MTPIFSLERVTGEGLIHAWPAVERVLQEDVEGWSVLGDLEAIKRGLFSSALQLWVLLDDDRVVRLMVMTQLVFYPDFQALRVVWAKGRDAKEAVMSYEDLETAARNMGCARMEVIGRGGWQRLLKPLGYRSVLQLYAKELGDENAVKH